MDFKASSETVTVKNTELSTSVSGDPISSSTGTLSESVSPEWSAESAWQHTHSQRPHIIFIHCDNCFKIDMQSTLAARYCSTPLIITVKAEAEDWLRVFFFSFICIAIFSFSGVFVIFFVCVIFNGFTLLLIKKSVSCCFTEGKQSLVLSSSERESFRKTVTVCHWQGDTCV